MFEGFSEEALDFLNGIRLNNNKEWFEARKNIYTHNLYEPMKALGNEIFQPFSDIDGMICKVGRIYRDESFAPYLHYRDTLWIYVRHDAMYWSKTPTLYFEISPDGAEFGFRISAPSASVMERFRNDISNSPEKFLNMVNELESVHGMTIGGDEYKRRKKCSVPEAERFFAKKGLSAYITIKEKNELFSRCLSDRIIKTFKTVMPLYDYFRELVNNVENAKKLLNEENIGTESAIDLVKAPDVDFMW